MWLWKFFRKFSLPCSLVLGAMGYLILPMFRFWNPWAMLWDQNW